jgi:hypothetical protein
VQATWPLHLSTTYWETRLFVCHEMSTRCTPCVQLGEVRSEIDQLHNSTFSGVSFHDSGSSTNAAADEAAATVQHVDRMTETSFAMLGRDSPASSVCCCSAAAAAHTLKVRN